MKKVLLIIAAGVMLFVLAACGGSQEVAGRTITGQLVDPYGAPVVYKTVAIAGVQSTLTDTEGRFEISNVPDGPYDLIIANAYSGLEETSVGAKAALVYRENSLLIYKGLTKDEINLTVATVDTEPPYAVSVSGLLNPQRSSEEEDLEPTKNGVWIDAGYFNASVTFDSSASSDESYGLRIGYGPDAEIESRICAARWSLDDSGDAAYFLGFYSGNLELAGEDVTRDIELQELDPEDGSRTVNVSLNLPDVYGSWAARHYLTMNPYGGGVRTAYLDDEDFGGEAVSSLSFVVPAVDGVFSNISVSADYGLGNRGGEAVVWKVTDSSDVAITMPEPLVVMTPMDGAELDPETRFSWAGPENAIYSVSIFLDTCCIGPLSITVITTDNSLSIPDLSALGVSLDDMVNSGGFWVLSAIGGQDMPASMDGLDVENTKKIYFSRVAANHPVPDGFEEFAFGGEFASSWY